jgi:hypothetical protein
MCHLVCHTALDFSVHAQQGSDLMDHKKESTNPHFIKTESP